MPRHRQSRSKCGDVSNMHVRIKGSNLGSEHRGARGFLQIFQNKFRGPRDRRPKYFMAQ